MAPEASTQTVLVGADLPRDPHAARALYRPYSPELGYQIADLYSQGKSLAQIAAISEMPSVGAIYGWQKDKSEFREMMDGARAMRALACEEQAVEFALSPTNKDDVPAARLAFDSKVWQASVNDPARYGRKTTVSGDTSAPITIQVVTGVPISPHSKNLVMGAGGIVKEVVAEVSEIPEKEVQDDH